MRAPLGELTCKQIESGQSFAHQTQCFRTFFHNPASRADVNDPHPCVKPGAGHCLGTPGGGGGSRAGGEPPTNPPFNPPTLHTIYLCFAGPHWLKFGGRSPLCGTLGGPLIRRGHKKQWIITSPENSTHQELNQEPFILKTMLLTIQLPSSADKSCALNASLTEHYVKKFQCP